MNLDVGSVINKALLIGKLIKGDIMIYYSESLLIIVQILWMLINISDFNHILKQKLI